MQPRGQLWFALEAMCRDFVDCSGMPRKEALETLLIVLTNMRAERQDELDQLIKETTSPSDGL